MKAPGMYSILIFFVLDAVISESNTTEHDLLLRLLLFYCVNECMPIVLPSFVPPSSWCRMIFLRFFDLPFAVDTAPATACSPNIFIGTSH